MNTRSRLISGIILSAVALGVIGDGLFRVTSWGFNLAAWTGALLVCVVVLNARAGRHLGWRQGGLLLVLLLASLGPAQSDSIFLEFLDLVTMLTAGTLAIWWARGGRLLAAGIHEYAGRIIQNGVLICLGAANLFAAGTLKDIPAREWLARRNVVRLLRVGLGTLLAIPVLIIFGVLFASADALFRDQLKSLFDVDFSSLFGHAALFGVCTWLSMGYLIRLLCTDDRPAPPPLPGHERGPVAAVEIPMILGLLNVLFAAFVLVQVRHLFGDAHLVQLTPQLTYAAYARNGFFELVTVAALVLPLLLIADWLLGDAADKRWYRRLSAGLVILLFVIMASALKRMLLYVDEYGLTETRLYVCALMFWLALVFVWFGGTVWRGKGGPFVAGALVTGLVILIGLHVLNPDALIARINLQRQAEGKRFDAAYLVTLGAGAVPTLISALPRLSANDQSTIRRLLARREKDWNSDWRSWNNARAHAKESVASYFNAFPLTVAEANAGVSRTDYQGR